MNNDDLNKPPEQPVMPTQTPGIQPAVVVGSVTPTEPTQVSPETPQVVTNTPANFQVSAPVIGQTFSSPNKSRKKTFIFITCVIGLLLIGGSVFAFLKLKSNGATVSSANCTPALTSTLDEASGKLAYSAFTKAIKTKNQTCVDLMSSDVFKKLEARTYSAPDGNWLNKKNDTKSGVDFFGGLPNDLDTSKLKQEDYVRPDYSGFPGLENADQPTGVTIKYSVDSGSGYQVNLKLSFIYENGKILVDDLKAVPAQLDSSSKE